MEHSGTHKRSVTVQDVARRAGVSKATAARVLGGYGVTSDAVKAKVLAASKELGYQPNELARSISTGRSGTIGVIVGDIENPYFGLAVRGISDAASAAGFDVILANSGEEIEKERDAVRVLTGKRVDGLIVTPARTSETRHLQEVHQSGRPLVLLDRAVPGLNVDMVVCDDKDAASAATWLLIRAGHRRIAYISAVASDDPIYKSRDQIDTSTVMERIDGFLDASRQAGIERPERFIRLGATGSAASRKIVTDLLNLPERPTAILASDNLVALEVFKTIRGLGLSLPDDVSLIAFHDADWTSVTSPPVTVIAQPIYDLGLESARILIERIRGTAAAPRQVVVKTTLIERQSTGAPADEAPPSRRARASKRIAS
ncbi:LacI family transcriptional regulator [Microvirga sp. KLBC 81]|uniref:LacI family DNA-binding transcriptional regulator n=1 Tax=Microvirga sp. KLBC 81 TaxID=1862707 RepID=UPI000D51E2E6|nr:LacI family DNA-binding transcriptional regulator [Microvirga sp. KLBC 81]PVE20779.1 LacI family transcriptional regulator [Microvirga sp. KLBC 81]